MRNLKETKKLSLMVVAIFIMLSTLFTLNSEKVYATENEASLDEIFEVYNNADSSADGMLLAPNPNADDTDLNDVLDVYNNSDKLEDGALLAPNPSEEQELISPAPKKSTNVGLIVGIVVIAVVIVGGIVFIIKKRK